MRCDMHWNSTSSVQSGCSKEKEYGRSGQNQKVFQSEQITEASDDQFDRELGAWDLLCSDDRIGAIAPFLCLF